VFESLRSCVIGLLPSHPALARPSSTPQALVFADLRKAVGKKQKGEFSDNSNPTPLF
jgi:hypothetical protein